MEERGHEGSKTVNCAMQATGHRRRGQSIPQRGKTYRTSAEVARLRDDWLRTLFQHLFATYAFLIRGPNIMRWFVSGPSSKPKVIH